jgi:tetratricopeptide (TPR) repeat protein
VEKYKQMTDLIANFQELINGLSSSESQEADLLLFQLSDDDARLIRLCAIPHTFDTTTLQVLDPALSAAAAAKAIDEFQHFAAVLHLSNCLALHDVVRQQLFTQWLAPDRIEEFAAISRRLVLHFQPRASDNAVERGAKEYSFVFHLIGADFDEGFKHFRLLYQERREQLRTSDCEVLVRLLREYRPALPARLRAWLSYYEAEIASDARDWPRASSELKGILAQDLTPDIRSMALLRLGSVLRQSGQLADAQVACTEALDLARVSNGEGAPLHLVQYEIGLIARDQGDVERAQASLSESIRLARIVNDRLDIIAASNSLGTLLSRISPHEAIGIFEECLKLLDPARDGVRIAQVLNNLALAHANAGNWEESKSCYLRSLNIKRTAADERGQALTLFNLARVYQSSNEQAEARNALSEAARLFENVRDAMYAARAYRELARSARHAEPATEVLAFVRKALDFYRRTDDDTELRATEREFGRLLVPGRPWIKASIIVGAVIVVLLIVLFSCATGP